MYDTKFQCRYHKDDVFLETDNVNEDEKWFIRNVLYKEDLLNIFSIYQFEDDFNVFSDAISKLYSKIKECTRLRECMTKMAAKIISEDVEAGLCILYSYDYMYITHQCVSEYLECGSISPENIKLLEEIVTRNF
jgi:hypothetical protein